MNVKDLKAAALSESSIPHDYHHVPAAQSMPPHELERHNRLNAAPSKEESGDIHHKALHYYAHLHDSDHAAGKAQLHAGTPLERHYQSQMKQHIHSAYEVGHNLEYNHGVTPRELHALHFHHRHKSAGEFADATVNHVHSKRKAP